jgi:hypothetical protein
MRVLMQLLRGRTGWPLRCPPYIPGPAERTQARRAGGGSPIVRSAWTLTRRTSEDAAVIEGESRRRAKAEDVDDAAQVIDVGEPNYEAFDELVQAVEIFGADWDRDNPPRENGDED